MSGPDVPELRGEEAAAFVRAHGLGDLAGLFVDERPPQPDELSEWCGSCVRWHQLRDRSMTCAEPQCQVKTDGYHGLCPEHRP